MTAPSSGRTYLSRPDWMMSLFSWRSIDHEASGSAHRRLCSAAGFLRSRAVGSRPLASSPRSPRPSLHTTSKPRRSNTGRKAVRLTVESPNNPGAGFAVLPGTDFQDGTIETDLAVKITAPREFACRDSPALPSASSPTHTEYEILLPPPRNALADDPGYAQPRGAILRRAGFGMVPPSPRVAFRLRKLRRHSSLKHGSISASK